MIRLRRIWYYTVAFAWLLRPLWIVLGMLALIAGIVLGIAASVDSYLRADCARIGTYTELPTRYEGTNMFNRQCYIQEGGQWYPYEKWRGVPDGS